MITPGPFYCPYIGCLSANFRMILITQKVLNGSAPHYLQSIVLITQFQDILNKNKEVDYSPICL